MKILFDNTSLLESIRPFDDLGFVPTMGGIHKGHISLINKSKRLCKKTIVSIFLNPKQFNNKKDFKSYPRNIKKDLKILKKSQKVDFVYIPKFEDIYQNRKKSNINLSKKDKILCAKFRKGHFEGVLNVMNRLLSIIKSRHVFMGEKDFQQYTLIKRILGKKYKVNIIGCPTIREVNHVALSTRNKLLNKSDIKTASKIAKKLSKLKRLSLTNKLLDLSKYKNEFEKKFKIKIDYLEIRDEKKLKLNNIKTKFRIFIAYYINGVRLIDNF